MFARFNFNMLAPIFLTLLLAACGGGGSDSDNSSSASSPVTFDLGDDIVIYNDEVLTLTGPSDGNRSLRYKWQLVTGPTVAFSDDTAQATTVTYTPAMENETFVFRLTVDNGASSDSDTLQVTIKDRISEATKTGNPALLPANTSKLEQRIQDKVMLEQTALTTLHADIFGSDKVVYDPGKNSRFFYLNSLTSAREVVTGNNGHIFVTASEKSGRRTVATGSNILAEINSGSHTQFSPHMLNLIDWLLEPHELNRQSVAEVKVALMLMSNSNMNSVENWLQGQSSTVTVSRCIDEATLSSCVAEANLIITGSSNNMTEASVTSALDQSIVRQQSLLYVHNGSWNSTELTNPILSYFGVRTQPPGSPGNFFSEDAANWDSITQMRDATSSLHKLAEIAKHFQNDSFSFNIADCAGDDCDTIPAFSNEFLSISQALRSNIKSYDESAIDIFAIQDEYTLEKLFILLADRYRQSISFPMSKDSTDTLSFLKSYFADHLVYISRQFNPTQSDLGNFSRTDFGHVTPTSKALNITSHKSFRAAGVYALPGQTLTVTRTDNSPATASIFINTQRSGSTHHMDNNGYNRPKFLQSPKVPIAAGETIQITSPYGGTVQIGFGENNAAMSFNFSNIGKHPYWKTGDDDIAFAAALAAQDYDWVEIATDYFEIHQTAEKTEETLADIRWDTASELEYYITKYHHNYHKVLSGYQGKGIDVVDEIHDFATSNNFDIPVYSSVQHFNGDQATCGYGCSGNPYDAYWSFSVTGHGDLHEVGHNFESGRFKFNGFEGHSTTNFYSYYVKSRAQDEDTLSHSCQSLPFDSVLSDLQASQLEADPSADMATRGYSAWSYNALIVIEMMMHAEERGKLVNGWHLIPRLHILEKAYNTADNSDSDWDATKANLGFSTYTRSEATSLDKNDWLLVAASYSAGLDYRPFLDLFGLTYSAKASAQLDTFGFPAVDSAFYVPASNNSYCDSLVGHTKQNF